MDRWGFDFGRDFISAARMEMAVSSPLAQTVVRIVDNYRWPWPIFSPMELAYLSGELR